MAFSQGVRAINDISIKMYRTTVDAWRIRRSLLPLLAVVFPSELLLFLTNFLGRDLARNNSISSCRFGSVEKRQIDYHQTQGSKLFQASQYLTSMPFFTSIDVNF